MKNEWTGGQYSLFRGVLGLFLLFYYFKDLSFLPTLEGFFAVGGIIAAAFLLLGKSDHSAALVLIALLLGRLIVVELDPRTVALLSLVIFHACMPRKPYGSWDAAGRLDPKGEWRMPKRYYSAKWVIMVLLYTWWAFWPSNPISGPLHFLLVVTFALLALLQPIRPLVWLAMWLWQIVLFLKGSPNGVLLLAHFALFDPGWIKPKKRGHDAILFYDAPCGLCSLFVRFLLAERPHCQELKLAPLEGTTAKRLLRGNEGDTVVFYHHAKELVRFEAIGEVLQELGGLWRLSGYVIKKFPRPLYDLVARHRHKVRKNSCTPIPEEFSEIFLP